MTASQPLRFPVEPRDIPAEKAARRLHLTAAQFAEMLPQLFPRGFPKPDPTTGMFDLEAIDEWRRRRHPHLFLTHPERARDARAVVPRTGGLGSGQRENPLLSRQER
jgi:hypothetical protein